MIAFVAAFHGDIINIAFYGLVYMLMEDRIHGALICRTSVLKIKGNYCVEVSPKGILKDVCFFIFRVHFYLIIP